MLKTTTTKFSANRGDTLLIPVNNWSFGTGAYTNLDFNNQGYTLHGVKDGKLLITPDNQAFYGADSLAFLLSAPHGTPETSKVAAEWKYQPMVTGVAWDPIRD